MLKQHATVFRRFVIFIDLCICVESFFLAYWLAQKNSHLDPINTYLWLLPVTVFLWGNTLYLTGLYASFRLKRIFEILSKIFLAALLGLLAFGTLIYMFKWMHVSRLFVLLMFGCTAVFLCLEKILLIFLFRYLRWKGFNFRKIILVGTGKRAQRFIRQIDLHREFGLNIAGLIDEDELMIGKEVSGYKVLGTFDDMTRILKQNAIDQVIFVIRRAQIGKIEECILACETLGVMASVAVDHFDLKLSRVSQDEFEGFPLINFETAPTQVWHLCITRAVNLLVSTLMLILLSPLLIIVALIIKISSNGSVIFAQERVGLNGRRFMLYKFRTMYVDAEARLEALREFNEMQWPAFKMANDPRVTLVGNFLRKFSIDELPQLWNVWTGDMSLVGPRPPLPREVDQYDSWQRRRLSMKPGMTCLWQIKGRNKIVNFDEWMKLDLEYIDNWSLWLDFKILLKTIPVVLFGIGAK